VNKALAHPVSVAAFWLACVAVATLSLLPVPELPSISLDVWDKGQHAFGFCLLGVLGAVAYPRRRPKVWAGLLMFGLAIEIAQAASGWRTGDPLDWLADAVGITCAAVATRKLIRLAP
jgi:VanZ family protein